MAKSNQKTVKRRKEVPNHNKKDVGRPSEDEILKLEPRVVCLEQPKNGTASTEKHEETAEERNGQMMVRQCSTKKKLRKKTKRRPLKQEALHQKRDSDAKKDSNKRLEICRLSTCFKYRSVLDDLSMRKALEEKKRLPICPPYDLAATRVEEAYPLHRIISEDEWDYLLDVLELSNAGAEVSSDVYPRFVCNRVCKLDNIKDASQKRKLAGVFSYITHLVRLYDKFSVTDVSAAAKEHKIPDILLQRFLSLYNLAENRRELLIFTILVLTLHADNFSTDLYDISKDLRLSTLTLGNHCRYLGCKVEVIVGKMAVATLLLPLQFPVQYLEFLDCLRSIRIPL